MEREHKSITIIAKKRLSYNTRVKKQAHALAKNGYKVTIICISEPGKPRTEKIGHITYYRVNTITLTKSQIKRPALKIKRVSLKITRKIRRTIALTKLATTRNSKRYTSFAKATTRKVIVSLLHMGEATKNNIVAHIKNALRIFVLAYRKYGRQRKYVHRLTRFLLRTLIWTHANILHHKNTIKERVSQTTARWGSPLIKYMSPYYAIATIKIRCPAHTIQNITTYIKMTSLAARNNVHILRNIHLYIQQHKWVHVILFPISIIALSINKTEKDTHKEIKRNNTSILSKINTFSHNIQFTIYAIIIGMKEKSRIYISHDSYPLIPAFILSRITGGILIYDAVEYSGDRNTLRRPNRISKYVEGKIISSASSVITVGSEISKLISSTWDVKNIHVLMNCHEYVDTEDRLRFSNFGIYAKHIVLYTGSITHNNGLEDLVCSIDFVQNRDVEIVLMGPVTNRVFYDELLHIISNLKNKHKVHILDPVPTSLVVKYAMSAFAGVIPIKPNCLNHLYALPNKLFEYIMARLPIISSNLPNVRNIINEHNIGIVLEEISPITIAYAIDTMIDNKNMYQKMKNNLEGCARIYSWENEEKKFVQIIKSYS